MRIHSQVLDFYDDATREGLQKIAAPGELGGLAITVMSPHDLRQLHDDQFGLLVVTKEASVLRKFPVHDAAHSYLAGQYLGMNMHKLATPARIIAAYHVKLAADSYGVRVPATVAEMAAAYPEGMEGNTFVEGRDPYEPELDKQASVRWFEEHVEEMDPSQRHGVAMGILKEAHVAGLMPESMPLLKYASTSWNPHLEAHLLQRKSLLPRDEAARATLDKLASQTGSSDPEEFARVLDAFDTKTGIDRYYGRGLADAYDSTMGMDKQAWSDEIDGETITKDDLVKAAARPSFKSFFGETVKNAFVRDPVTIYESLPTPNKALILQISRGLA
jgi:hypothetical protein